MATCTVRIKIAWWLRWYLAGVQMMTLATGAQPDMRKVGAMVARAVSVKADGWDD